MNSYRKYIPWIISVVSGLLALWFSQQPPRTITAPGEPYEVKVHDTITVVEHAAQRTFVRRDSVRDTVRLAFLVGQRQDINDEIANYGETRDDIDTTLHFNLGDEAEVDVRVIAVYVVERAAYQLTASVDNLILHVPGNETWRWIERAAILVAGVLSRLIH